MTFYKNIYEANNYHKVINLAKE